MPHESIPVFSYDEFPYASYPYANSHPRNLAALAQLFAMRPAAVERCRVLEIGCAGGGNLIPMAAHLPESQFLGIDASQRQIDEGLQIVADLRLDNIELRCQDILDFAPQQGKFDFIICHGVYSWVPAEVQKKILAVCRDHLTTNGVAFVSYNTYPGWYLRQGVREMMNYHAAGFSQPQAKINQSRALVDFLVGAVQPNSDAYEKLLHEELNILRSSEDSYIYHEHLEDYNEPLFFHQFVSRAEEQGLRFMCEAQFGSMVANDYSEETRRTLSEIAPDLIQMEQYLDFLRNRKFRQSLLCHRDVQLDRVIEPDRLMTLYVNAPLDAGSVDECRPGAVFTHASGRTLTVANSIQAHAFKFLANHWPSDVSVLELAQHVCQALPEDDGIDLQSCLQELCESLLELYSASMVALVSTASGCVPQLSERPRVAALTHYQAGLGQRATNLRHESVQLDAFECEIIKCLDGGATIPQIADGLIAAGITMNHATTDADDVIQAGAPMDQDALRQVVRQKLVRLAQTGLLIG